jgi:hypothetical protein
MHYVLCEIRKKKEIAFTNWQKDGFLRISQQQVKLMFSRMIDLEISFSRIRAEIFELFSVASLWDLFFHPCGLSRVPSLCFLLG